MSKVIEITDQNFEEEILNSDLPTEVDFWAPWCNPCRMISPIYGKLSEEYDGKFKFCKINVDENQQTAMKYQIMSIPMQMFFAGGEKVDEILGAVPERTIRVMVDDIIQNYPSDEKSKLKVLLTSWIEHNNQHLEKLSNWKKNVDNLEANQVYNNALEAAQAVEIAKNKLSEVLHELAGEE